MAIRSNILSDPRFQQLLESSRAYGDGVTSNETNTSVGSNFIDARALAGLLGSGMYASAGLEADDVSDVRGVDVYGRNYEVYVVSLDRYFKYDPANVSADDGLNVIKPNNISASDPGRWVLLSVGTAGGSRELLYFDEMTLYGLSTSSSSISFANHSGKHFDVVVRNSPSLSWSRFFKYAYWMITGATTNTVLGPVKFDTFDEFIAYIKVNLPTTGTTFDDGAIRVEAYDEVDFLDPYPMLRRARNTMVATMMGRGRWLANQPATQYGVEAGFTGHYAPPIGTDLAAQMVNFFTGVLPPTNNNDAIWYTRKRKTRWNFPKHNRSILVNATTRGAAWDTVGGAWVTPAPVGGYTFVSANPSPPFTDSPFTLLDEKEQGTLSFKIQTIASNQRWPLTGVTSLVFAVMNGQYLSFAVYPYGADVLYTEYLDPTTYELQARINYRGRKSPRYSVIPPHQHDQLDHTMFKLWNVGAADNYVFPQGGSYDWAYKQNADNNFIPISIDICRRNLDTGIRSRWVPCLKVKRRIPHCNVHITPHHSWS